MRRKKEAGYTLVELLVLVVAIFVAFSVVAVLVGNFWFSEADVMRVIRIMNPEVRSVVLVERDIFSSSRIIVQNEGGGLSTFLVDSNLLFHYTIRKEKSR